MATKAQITRVLKGYSTAAAKGRDRRKQGDLAASVRYEADRNRVHIELLSGSALAIPVELIQGLKGATPAQLREVIVTGRGYGLCWQALDVDVAVPDLIAGSLGTRAWMRTLAKQGGKSTSVAKAAAARENGKRGGRPRKQAATA